tara:strand:- start:3937 stop:4743 length:807 start_codon:yes stop_codon:yes gene_type:complete
MNSGIKIGFFSDTHTLHKKWKNNFESFRHGDELENMWSELDILCFTGDCSSKGNPKKVEDFMEWFSNQPAKKKVMIAGNHDFFFDIDYRNKQLRHNNDKSPQEEVEEMLSKFPDIHYLNDSGVKLFGLNIWGSPVQPKFGNWVFNRNRNTIVNGDGSISKYNGKPISNEIKNHWDMIPNNTDVLLTHGPPFKHGDLLAHKSRRIGECPNVGCVDLSIAIERVKPKIVAFGHIHEGYGKVKGSDGIIYINSSSLNEEYSPVNAPKFHRI